LFNKIKKCINENKKNIPEYCLDTTYDEPLLILEQLNDNNNNNNKYQRILYEPLIKK
jgi:hypothetical protein